MKYTNERWKSDKLVLSGEKAASRGIKVSSIYSQRAFSRSQGSESCLNQI